MFLEESVSQGISEELLKVEGIDNGIENYHEAMLYAVAENESNFSAIMRSAAVGELKSYKEGVDFWNEATTGGFMSKVKAFFIRLWQKIKGVFARFMSRFDQFARGGKSFFDKYKKQLADKFAKIDHDKVKFVGYTFQNIGGTANSTISSFQGAAFNASEAATYAGKDEDALTEEIETFRSKLVGGSGKVTSSEFSKELFEHFRKDGEKEEQSGVSFQSIAAVLGNSDKAKKGVETNYKGLEKAVNAVIKACEKGQSSAIDGQVKGEGDNATHVKNTAGYPKLIRVIKGKLEAAQTYIGAEMKACTDEISQAKAFAGQVLRAGVKHEDTSLEEGTIDTDNIFSSVTLR